MLYYMTTPTTAPDELHLSLHLQDTTCSVYITLGLPIVVFISH